MKKQTIMSGEERENFIKEVCEFKQKHNVTNYFIAKKMGIMAQTLANWEKGNGVDKILAERCRKFKNEFENKNLVDGKEVYPESYRIVTQKVKLIREKEQVILVEAEEIVYALKNGESVFDSDRSVFYKLIDGVICSFNKTTQELVAVNAILINDNLLYVMREKKIRLEVGKFYKTDKGDKIIVVYSMDKVFYCTVVGKEGDFVKTDEFGESIGVISEWKD